MTKTRAFGLTLLCALLASAFAAQGAWATNGTTAFTCVKGAGTLKGEHCLTEGTAAAEYGHVAIPQDTTTETTATNEKTFNNTTEASTQRLKMNMFGIVVELTATVAEGEGWTENKLDPNGEHYAEAHGTLTYTNVKVAKPGGKGCKIFTDNGGVKAEEAVIHTVPVRGTTTEEGDNVKVTPTEGNIFASFIIEGCEGEALKILNSPYRIEGSLTCPINGATITCTHSGTTATETLKVLGPLGVINAGLDGSLTLKGKAEEAPCTEPEPYTPLSATTVET